MPRDNRVPCSWLPAQQTNLLESGRNLHIKGLQTPLNSPSPPFTCCELQSRTPPRSSSLLFWTVHPLPPACPSLDGATGAARKDPSLRREVIPNQRTITKEFDRGKMDESILSLKTEFPALQLAHSVLIWPRKLISMLQFSTHAR